MAGRKIIPVLRDGGPLSIPVPFSGEIRTTAGRIEDARGRPLTDLRISLTDHCNFRCRYCMPREKYDRRHRFLTQTELISFEEVVRMARLLAPFGVKKLRLTGGEPLLRKGVDRLIARLRQLRTADGGPFEIAMTTNGAILGRMAHRLRAAGLDRVTVSLDALDEKLFQSINDVGFPAARVLDGIWAARDAGLAVKVNTVVKRGMNEGEIVPLAEVFRGTGVTVRYIEYMDAGTANGWRPEDVVTGAEVVRMIAARHPLLAACDHLPGETARRWRYADGSGEIGVICSVSEPFCRECSRVRLSVEGRLFLCLFADRGYDIRTMLRGGATDGEIAEAVARIWSGRADHYSEVRAQGRPVRGRVEMQYIGG